MGENQKIKKKTVKRKKEIEAPVMSKIIKKEPEETKIVTKHLKKQNVECQELDLKKPSVEEISARFPVINNEELVKKFMAVPLTNNQKGRIRQVLRDNLKGTSEHLFPDIVHSRIQAMLKSTDNLTDSDLRKIRILYNMLKTAVCNEKLNIKKQSVDKKSKGQQQKTLDENAVQKTDKKKVKVEKIEADVLEKSEKKGMKDKQKKEKGKRRYVVFVGNLPLDVTKEVLMSHFSVLGDNIVDVRLPKQKEDKKSAIAYVELKSEPIYELALSKHHSMLGSKRINVLYTTQKNGKITKAQAKSKSAKLQALQKSGKLIGSTAANRKRSHRRMKMKKAQALREKELTI